MAIYYVAKTGNDVNPGTEALPKLTINGTKGLPSAGDTVLIKTGVYAETLDYTNGNGWPEGTSWANAVTWAAYPGTPPYDAVSIRGPAGANIMTVIDRSYVIFRGLYFDGTDATHLWSCVKVTFTGADSSLTAAHHIRFLDCEMAWGGQGILASTDSDFGEVLNCDMHDIGIKGTGDFHRHGVYLSVGPKNWLIDGCTLHHNEGYGIHDYTDPALVAEGANNIIRNNRIYSNAEGGAGGRGIICGGADIQIYNNEIWDNNGGIQLRFHTPIERPLIYNNTIVGNNKNGGGVAIEVSDFFTTVTDAEIKNNIIYNNTAGTITDNGTNTDASNNLTTNPFFQDEGGNDYHLTGASIGAIDQGVDLSAVFTTDFDGNTRDATFDIGAYEFGNPVVPPVNTIGNQSTQQNAAGPLTGISVSNPDNSALTVWLTLEGGKGTLAGVDVNSAVGTFST